MDQYLKTSKMTSSPSPQSSTATNGQPYVRIVEQPAKCALRFRYECEGRSAGSIPGSNATADNKTYPTIQVCNYRGQAVVVVSCVTKEQPYRPHPHNLVGKEGCKKGVCTMVINNQDMLCSFTSLGIQCVKRKDIEDSLKLRESIKVDPFRTGFSHKTQSSSIDLNVVRLCFQVFIEGPEKDKFTVQLPPVVSDYIYDKKAMTELIITKLSHCSAPCSGGKEVILLCDRVTKDDVQVRFYQELNGQIVWETLADFGPGDVHKQVAICFRTPRYINENITQPVSVQLQLRRPSDGCLSEPRGFQLLPREVDPDGLARKRQKIEEGCLERFLRENSLLTSGVSSGAGIGGSAIVSPRSPPKREVIQVPRMTPTIKLEPLNATTIDTLQLTQSLTIAPPCSTSTTWATTQYFPLSPQQQTLQQHIRPQMDLLLTQDYRQSSPVSPQMSSKVSQSTAQPEFILPHNNQNDIINKTNTSKTLSQTLSAAVNTLLQPSIDHIDNHNIVFDNNNLNNNNITDEVMEKFDSLGLDIDTSELLSDINFNSMSMMAVMLNSDGNISLNSRENLLNSRDNILVSSTLQTPDVSDEANRNLMGNPQQMQRLHTKLIQLEKINNNNAVNVSNDNNNN